MEKRKERGKSRKVGKEPEILTFQEAQDFLRVSHQTLYKLMREGLVSHKIGKKRVFFKEDLRRWVEKH